MRYKIIIARCNINYLKYTKITLIAFILILCGLSQAEQIDNLPPEFSNTFVISSKGVISSKVTSRDETVHPSVTHELSSESQRVFSKNSGTSAWHIGSKLCPQNKQYNCLSVYNRDSSKIRGNQMNPFADEDHLGNYSLYRVDKNTGVLSSVIKCKSMFTTKLTVDEGSLKNCHEYSQNKCSEWFNYINKESGLVNGDMEKARECTDLFAKIDRARLRAVQIFQGDLKNSQKDLETQFDDSTRADKGLRIAASVKVTSTKPHPTLLKYEDLIDHSSECASNAAWFEKDQRNQAYLRGLFSTPATDSGRSTQGRSPSTQQGRQRTNNSR